MELDHITNPLGIVKRFSIPYGDGLHLGAHIRAITEEGYTDPNWFEFRVFYPSHRNVEIGGNLNSYRELKRGTSTPEETEARLRSWCKVSNLELIELN